MAIAKKSADTLLAVKDLGVTFATDQGPLTLVDQLSFEVNKGETLGLVGEYGCGKSITALAIMGLLPQPVGRIHAGSIHFAGHSLTQLSPLKRRALRGKRIAMIFQDPLSALNPVQRIGKQIVEVFRLHFPHQSAAQQRQDAIHMLTKVGIPAAEQRFNEYPHQLSGGMRQRVVIAMALACRPQLLIADEPTTALDVTIQAQILALLKELQAETQMAILFITHDLGVVAQMCDRVIVMYAGRMVESAPCEAFYQQPCHPYSQGLLGSIPHLQSQAKSPLKAIPGFVPTFADMPAGCRFNNRCPHKQTQCEQQPLLTAVNQQRQVACWRWREIA